MAVTLMYLGGLMIEEGAPEAAEAPLAAALRERPEWDGVVLFTNNPTSETLAQVLADQGLASLRARFGMKVVEVSVTVRETCTTSCTYTARP